MIASTSILIFMRGLGRSHPYSGGVLILFFSARRAGTPPRGQMLRVTAILAWIIFSLENAELLRLPHSKI